MKGSLEFEKEKSASDKIKELKEEAASKTSKTIEYNLIYDAIGEGLEPIYFWLLDFMQDSEPSGLGMDEVIKNKNEY